MWSTIQPFLARSIFLPVWTLRTRSPYLHYFRYLRRTFQWLPTAEWQAYQRRQLKAILVHAYETTAYYRQVFDGHHFSPHGFERFEELQKLPILTKDIVRKHFDQLVSSTYPKHRLHKNATGGSTGTPLVYYVTPERETAQAATMALNYEWAGLGLGERLAMLWGAPFEISRAQSFRGVLEKHLLGRLLLPTFAISDEILKRYLIEIQKFKPTVLLGYASSLLAMADFLERTHTPPPTLTSIISGAETLYDHDRARLERVFQCQVFNRYGGRDSGAVAAECPEYRRMHLNVNLGYVETTSEGRILITDFWNRGMPFVRYDPEDLGTISREPCECGRSTPWFTEIRGRVHDMLVKPNGELVPGEFFPHLFKDVHGIRRFQVIQEQPSELTINIVKDPVRFKDQDVEYLRNHIQEYFGSVTVNFIPVEDIAPSASGKHRFTISRVKSSQS